MRHMRTASETRLAINTVLSDEEDDSCWLEDSELAVSADPADAAAALVETAVERTVVASPIATVEKPEEEEVEEEADALLDEKEEESEEEVDDKPMLPLLLVGGK